MGCVRFQNTALHLAARAGHVAAVQLLLMKGAQILLNWSEASFLHEAVHNYRKEVTIGVIDSDRSAAQHAPEAVLCVCLCSCLSLPICSGVSCLKKIKCWYH